MWLLLQGWLLRNVLTLLGWLAAAAAVAAALFGAPAGRPQCQACRKHAADFKVQHDHTCVILCADRRLGDTPIRKGAK